jgi:hypothetical protein
VLVRTIHHHRRLTTSETALASALRYIQVRARPASMGEWADVGGNTAQEEKLPGVHLPALLSPVFPAPVILAHRPGLPPATLATPPIYHRHAYKPALHRI